MLAENGTRFVPGTGRLCDVFYKCRECMALWEKGERPVRGKR